MTDIRNRVCAAIIQDGEILLVEFDDETGLHYNLPGGGVKPGESLHEALRREVREETTADVTIGRLLLVWEYVPSHLNGKYGAQQSVTMLFEASLNVGSTPRMPDHPDPNQTGVHWVSLDDLPTVGLVPPPDEQLMAVLRGESVDVFWERR